MFSIRFYLSFSGFIEPIEFEEIIKSIGTDIGIHPEEKHQVVKLFKELDKNNDGKIDK